MGYQHINNLYKDKNILKFPECYALEKVHGSSSHVSWDGKEVKYFSGGEKHSNFVKIFEGMGLEEKFKSLGIENANITVWGEVYGGKCQGMSNTYGPNLSFIAFEVSIDKVWLNIPKAEEIVLKLGLEYVPYTKVTTNVISLDAERDKDSEVAIRRGMGPGKKREGVVLFPIHQCLDEYGERIMAKHKQAEFQETKTPRKVEVDPEKLKVIEDAKLAADEWVTPMRLNHVLDKIPGHRIDMMSEIISAMYEDVVREGINEVVPGEALKKAVGKNTVFLYKQLLQKGLNGELQSTNN